MSEDSPWPLRPYKGLANYSHADAPLFVGRNREVEACAERLLPNRLSLFILHGLSGSGKSSFLRAGLLPYLENLPNGLYYSGGEHRYSEGLTILRSGHSPLEALARAVWKLTESLDQAFGSEEQGSKVRRAARLGKRSLGKFVEHTGGDAENMFRSLEQLSTALPNKLFFVIDQAEDIFSSNGTRSEDQSAFFSLLVLLSNMTLDLKLLLSMRSEFKARFDEELSAREVDASTVDSYYLKPIDQDGIVAAILHPTQRDPVDWYGRILPPPYRTYRFGYDEGLAELICKDLLKRTEPSSWLPVLQVICDRLYTKLPQQDERRITVHDYRATGACNAQVTSHVEEQIVKFFAPRENTGISLAGQADRWKTLLADLTETQLDGKVRARLCVSHLQIVEDARREKCLEPEPMLEWLARPEHYVLERTDGVPKDPTPGWRLLHDSIAAALVQWRDSDAIQRARSISDSDPMLETASEDYLDAPKSGLVTFSTVNDLIWDHLIAIYAEARGFSKRLGLRFEAESRFDLTKTKKTIDSEGFLLTSPPDRYRLVVEPLVLYPKLRQEPWTIVGIPNVYRGYAILGRERDDLQPVRGPHDGMGADSTTLHWQRLHDIAKFLAEPATKIGVLEERSRDFVNFILSCFGFYRDKIPIFGERYTSARDKVFTALVAGDIDFGLGPAPSRALAEQAGFLVYADFEDVYRVATDDRKPELERLLMHEVCAVDVPLSERPTLLRLVSVLLYTVDHIRRNPEDFVAFVHDQVLLSLNDDGYWLQRRYIRQAVESCYSYAASSDYAFKYLNASSKTYLDSTGTSIATLYDEWISRRVACDELIQKLMPLTRISWSRDAEDAFSRGERLYRIYDYYDAHLEFARAADLVLPA